MSVVSCQLSVVSGIFSPSPHLPCFNKNLIPYNLTYGYEEALIIYLVGKMEIKLHFAEVLLQDADEFIDKRLVDGTKSNAVEASIPVAEAKAFT
ncbi:hypothetical protein JYQ62_07005 [Nostoc sp. UHCC 0702]|nr:hypothetical protein JYQ62_07005 [Nostoc sp. UHCC 0702]